MTGINSGRDVLRAGLRSRKMGLANIARELEIPINALDSFVQGGTLAADRLNSIAAFIFGGAAIYDEASDLLRSANKQEPISMGVRPPLISEMNLDRSHLLPRVPPKPTAKLPPARPHRAGWAE
jgi:hypothetical protein